MKTKISEYILILIFGVLIICGTSLAASDSTGKLIVDISGFPSSDGYAMVALHNSEDSYKAGETAAIASTRTMVLDQKVRVVFTGLPYGWYGIALYHDENGDGKMDVNAMGIPREAYGFSNNARGFFGKPNYEDVRFQLNSAQKQISINLE